MKDQKEQLLARLDRLWQEGERHAAEIKRIIKAAGPGNILSHGDGSITPIEDDDDALIITMGPRQNLHRVVRQLWELHKNALELGMSDHPRVIQLGEALKPAA